MGGVWSRIEVFEQHPARARVVLAAVVALVLSTLITHGHYAGSGDAIHYMVMARSLALDHDLDVANDYSDTDTLIHIAPDLHVRVGREGHIRPVHDIGLPLLAAPYFLVCYRMAEHAAYLPESLSRMGAINGWIALRQMVSLGMIAVTTVLAVTFFDASRDFGVPTVTAFVGTTLWVLSPPVLSHGYVFFTEIPTALTALVIFRSLRDPKMWSPLRAFSVGALAGFLLLLHTRNIGLLAGLVIVATTTRRWSMATVLLSVCGILSLIVVRTAVTYNFWGTLVTTPLAQFGQWPGLIPTCREVLLRGTGLLFDPNHGLLPSAPIYFLAPVGWILLRRRSPAVAIQLALIVACYLLPVLMPTTNVQGWRGGWSPAARFLTPVSPFLGLPVVLAFERFSHQRIVQAIGLVQVSMSVLFWTFPMLMWSDGTTGAPFLAWVAGRRLADSLPRWDTWTPFIGVVGVMALTVWLAWTRHLVQRPSQLDPR